MSEIHVVDSIMGSGKTKGIIAMMNNATKKKYMYVAPYLEEAERIKNECPALNFIEPVEKHGSKSVHLEQLIREGSNISTTHQLFKKMGTNLCTKIKSKGYTLILDEVLDVFDDSPITKDDFGILKNEGLIAMHGDKSVTWERSNYNGLYNPIKFYCKQNALSRYGKKLVWLFPPDIFNAFKEAYILTYMFDGSILKAYCNKFGLVYDYYHAESDNGQFYINKGYDPNKGHCFDTSLIKILENGRMNGTDDAALSKTWYNNNLNLEAINQMKRNVSNYFRNINQEIPQNERMWTVFKDKTTRIAGPGYSAKDCFVACNERATNKWAHKSTLAYLINCFPQTDTYNFFHDAQTNAGFDRSLYGLSSLLQWIWRSRIRNGEPINIYLPSSRMRKLLKEWMNGFSS